MVALALAGAAQGARGDGGALRVSKMVGDRVISVFTSTTPLRAGTVDVSVLVQEASSGRALTEIPIIVRAYPVNRPEYSIRKSATSEAATNKLLLAASVEMQEPGEWRVEISLPEAAGGLPVAFEVPVAAALPPWLDLVFWICWPALAVGLFAIHETLVIRRLKIHQPDARARALAGASGWYSY